MHLRCAKYATSTGCGRLAPLAAAFFFFLLATPIHAPAQMVHGQVVDSITGGPLSGVTVQLLDSTGVLVGSRQSDASGLFLLRPGAAGSYSIRAEHAGYRTSTFPVFTLGADQTLSYMLLLASLTAEQEYASILEGVCPDARGGGAVFGWVRDADTRTSVDSGAVRVSWASVPTFLSEAVSVGEFTGEAAIDSAGFYQICGVPMNTRIWLHADVPSGHSDLTNLSFRDGLVTTGSATFEAVSNQWRQDFLIVPDHERSTGVTGVVTMASDGQPASDATVEILGTDFATETGSDGRFLLDHLPSGPARIVVKQIGSERLQRDVLLPGEGTLEIPNHELILGAAQVLAPMIVETTPGHNPLAEFHTRRATGVGNFITRDEFMEQGSPVTAIDVLRRMPGIKILTSGNLDQRHIISMSRGGPRTFGFASDGMNDRSGATDTDMTRVNPCPPLIFMDRHYIGNVNQIDVEGAVPLETVEAVETHQSSATLPNEYSRPGSSCGVIAFWTQFAEPRMMEVTDQQRANRSLLDTSGFHVFLAMSFVVGIFFALGKAIHF